MAWYKFLGRAAGGVAVATSAGSLVGWLAEREETKRTQARSDAAVHVAREARRADEARSNAWADRIEIVARTLPKLTPDAQVAVARQLARSLTAGPRGLPPGGEARRALEE